MVQYFIVTMLIIYQLVGMLKISITEINIDILEYFH